MEVVLGAVSDGTSILFLERRREPYEGYWGFPGGKICDGEVPRDALVREFSEEANVSVTDIRERGFFREFIVYPGRPVFTFDFFLFTGRFSGVIESGSEGRVRRVRLSAVYDDSILVNPTDRILLSLLRRPLLAYLRGYFFVERIGREYVLRSWTVRAHSKIHKAADV